MKWTILARTGSDKVNIPEQMNNGTLPTPNQQDQNMKTRTGNWKEQYHIRPNAKNRRTNLIHANRSNHTNYNI
jgi:hypothetical protein